jgi:hypothetical protein
MTKSMKLHKKLKIRPPYPMVRRSSAFVITNAGDQIVKRMTLNGSFSTGAGTAIAVISVTSGSVTSATEWASFSARYQQYRVRAIRVTGKAIQPIQTATIVHSALFRGRYIGTSVPSSSAQVLADENVKQSCTNKDFVDIVTWQGIPDAKLWNPTSAAIPSVNQFSLVYASNPSGVLTTGTTYYVNTYEYEVEFRGSQ